MEKWPQPFWANILAVQGGILCLVALIYPGKENLSLAVIAVGSNLVSGALGAFAATHQNPKINPISPAEPAQQ